MKLPEIIFCRESTKIIRVSKKKEYEMIKKSILIVISVFMTIGTAFASTKTSLEGVIKGAHCIVYKGECNEKSSDPHLALEREFVLVAPDGSYYFMPNISRMIKTNNFNKPVRITGRLEGQRINVATIEEKKNDKYYEVWNWQNIRKGLRR